MPQKSNQQTVQTSSTVTPPTGFTFSVMPLSQIPSQKRLGRKSKFIGLFQRLQTLTKDEVLSFPIQKYTQIQGLRNKLKDLGFTITTRSEKDVSGNSTITAYVLHTPPEETTKS